MSNDLASDVALAVDLAGKVLPVSPKDDALFTEWEKGQTFLVVDVPRLARAHQLIKEIDLAAATLQVSDAALLQAYLVVGVEDPVP